MQRYIALGVSALMMSQLNTPVAAQEKSAVQLACIPQRPENLSSRPSPYDSVSISIGSQQAKLCYSRPSAKGRKMIGGTEVAFGELWRTGANEPTILHLAFPAMIAGVHVEPGSYSIYSVPSAREWEIIINRSITQWGHENRYTPEIKAQEIGRGKARSESIPNHVEMMLFRAEPAGARGVDLLLEWENTRVRIPIRLM